ncbi:hypothetical protein ACTU3I_09575 [Microbacterium sp. RD1]|uniref:hypothetical protein n=1 Tax=Microbacterium sp. RD1 TaxID=3457313 RepID=UPI003FA577EC
MIANFLRRPVGVVAWSADAVRALGVLSVVLAGVAASPTDAGILAFALPALMAPRFLAVRPGLDVASGVIVLIAAWSNVLDLYRTIAWWDLAVHFACTGAIALLLYIAGERSGVFASPRGRARTPLLLLPTIGLAISALWEMVEWAGYTYVSDDIFVAYADTVGDMTLGGLGAAAAGVLAARIRLVD